MDFIQKGWDLLHLIHDDGCFGTSPIQFLAQQRRPPGEPLELIALQKVIDNGIREKSLDKGALSDLSGSPKEEAIVHCIIECKKSLVFHAIMYRKSKVALANLDKFRINTRDIRENIPRDTHPCGFRSGEVAFKTFSVSLPCPWDRAGVAKEHRDQVALEMA